jgi:NADH-quinone oxidoreductase subunit D
MRESVKIIKQCLEKMPKNGDIMVNNPKISPPKRYEMKETAKSERSKSHV